MSSIRRVVVYAQKEETISSTVRVSMLWTSEADQRTQNEAQQCRPNNIQTSALQVENIDPAIAEILRDVFGD